VTDSYVVRPIGRVDSPLVERGDAPRQGDEGAPEAWLELDAAIAPAGADLAVGDDVIVLTWLDRADRDVLRVHPRNDPDAPVQGVFSTRSADRPNPIGLHTVRILAIDGNRLRVSGLEAIDATPVLDIKPVLGPIDTR
jgi:tRNA-Thr(GGU) m(6)t(6)A37 methyltransferase TsaA